MLRAMMAAFVSLIFISGCTSPVSTATVAADAHIIVSGLQGALSNPAVESLVPASSQSIIDKALSDLVLASGALASSPSAATVKPAVAQIEGDVNSIITALAGLALPVPVPEVLSAAAVLLPVIEAAVGLSVPASANAGSMTPDEARLVLAAASR